jgi:hypothetical protein
MRHLLFLLFCCLTQAVFAQSRGSEHTLKLDPGTARPKAAIADVSFIAGHWTGSAFDGMAEEIWSPPLGPSMMGMYKMLKDGKVVFHEFLIIVEEQGSLTLKLKHFNPDLTGWEEKDKYVSFPLVKVDKNEAYFDGMTFRKTKDGSLQVYLLIEDHKTGKTSEHEFLYNAR